jgi:hypothetical protein
VDGQARLENIMVKSMRSYAQLNQSRQNLFGVISFCENSIDCRRKLQLQVPYRTHARTRTRTRTRTLQSEDIVVRGGSLDRNL